MAAWYRIANVNHEVTNCDLMMITEYKTDAGKIKDVLEQFPHWRKNEHHEREVKQSFYSVFLQNGLKDLAKAKELVETIISDLRGKEV